MSDFKKYPEEAAGVREQVESRRHYLSLVYAMAVIATFQLCTSAGWYTYLNEAYYHLTESSEHFMFIIGFLGQFLAICLIYIAIYVRKSALLVLLVLIYFAAMAFKLIQISVVHPNPGFRPRFSALTRPSQYDAMSLFYDIAIFYTSLVNMAMSVVATWHFTPLVIVKVDWSKEEKKLQKAIRVRNKDRSSRTSYSVMSGNDENTIEVAESSGRSYKTKVVRKRTMKTHVDDNSDVTVVNSKTTSRDGGVYDTNGKKIQNVRPSNRV